MDVAMECETPQGSLQGLVLLVAAAMPILANHEPRPRILEHLHFF